MFSEYDFDNDGHEAEILFRVGPIAFEKVKQSIALAEKERLIKLRSACLITKA